MVCRLVHKIAEVIHCPVPCSTSSSTGNAPEPIFGGSSHDSPLLRMARAGETMAALDTRNEMIQRIPESVRASIFILNWLLDADLV